MLRDLNVSSNGRRICGTPKVGILASAIPSGFALPALLENDFDAGFPNRLYSVEVTVLPAAGLYVYEDSSFVFAAPDGTYTGTTRVRKYDPGVGLVSTADAALNLDIGVAAETPAPTVTSVAVAPSTVTLAGGSAQQFSVTVAGANSPSQTVTWTAAAGTITEAGMFTAPAATSTAQTIVITATSVQDSTKSGTATVTIAAVAQPTVTGVTVSPTTATGSQQFTAAVAGVNLPSQAVTWSKTGGGALSASGQFTAPAATSTAQTIVITATSVQDSTKSGTATVTIAAVAQPTVTGVSVSPTSATVAGGTTQQFTAAVAGTNSPSQAVTWAATAGQINASGQFTAPAATSTAQTIVITATSVQDGAKFGSATLIVAAVVVAPPASVVTEVAVSPTSATGSTKFVAAVTGANSPSQVVNWAASAGQITADGVFTAPAAGYTVQTVTVTAASAQDASKMGVATVTIAAIPRPVVYGVIVSPKTATSSRTFKAVVDGANAPSTAVTWSVDAGQITPGGVFTAPAATYDQQVITVTATSEQDPTKSGVATVTVAATPRPVVYGVTVTPGKPYVAGGASKAFSAVIDGANSPSTAVTWATTFGSITTGGVLTVPATSVPRKAVVTATSVQDTSKTGATSVTVTPPVLYGVAGPRSKARTYVVTEPQVAPDTSDGTGTFWNYSNPAKPKGIKDPDSVIDIPFDYRKVFADSGDNYVSHEILANNGAVLIATNHDAGIITAFVAAGDPGPLAAVTCRAKSDSTPPRIVDRTVYLRISEQ